ncbi:hypothetical protein IF1G_05222 [Cordyceps javanica]|uniref:Uncharacterized protein n=1 Tax=Cordyceps javanica TaxID=43265 RepID=A0A545W1S4_9HYPO|nr:hypothetical protein IF1G_05222 [Cordyceps javanica]TQW07914.1 hypothetical protein IF2G_05075 [Cordyceps javanica]
MYSPLVYFTNDIKRKRQQFNLFCSRSVKVCPLARDGFLLEVFPPGAIDLHLGLLHGLDNLQLTLGNFNNLLDKAGTDLLLEFLDPDLLVSRQLRLILPLDLLVVLEGLALSPDDLVGALSRSADALKLAALVLLAIPLLNALIAGEMPGADYEDTVPELDGAGLAAVDAAASYAELLGIAAHQLPGFGRPRLVAGRRVLLDERQAMLGHGLDRLAVQRCRRQRL